MSAARIALCSLALAALPACSGTETGNPPFAPEVGYGGHDPMGLAPDPVLTRARVAIDEVSIVDCEGGTYPLLRALTVDFVTGETRGGMPLEIPGGLYCELVVSVGACTDPERCRAVDPDALALDGTRRDGATVRVRDTAPAEITLTGRWEMSPEAGGVLLALDREALVVGAEIATAVPEMGFVLINEFDDPARLAAIRAGLAAGLELRRDLDGDSALDPEELDGEALASP
jgi:hypothetical protein